MRGCSCGTCAKIDGFLFHPSEYFFICACVLRDVFQLFLPSKRISSRSHEINEFLVVVPAILMNVNDTHKKLLMTIRLFRLDEDSDLLCVSEVNESIFDSYGCTPRLYLLISAFFTAIDS